MSYINKMHNVFIGASAVTSVAVLLAGCHKQFDCSSADSLDVCFQHSNCAWVPQHNMLTTGAQPPPGQCVASEQALGIDCASFGWYWSNTYQSCVERCHVDQYISSDGNSCVENCPLTEYIGSDKISCVKECGAGENIARNYIGGELVAQYCETD